MIVPARWIAPTVARADVLAVRAHVTTPRVSSHGVVQMAQVTGFWIFLKTASRLVPDGWVEI